MTSSYYSDILISMNYIQTITKIRERGQMTIPMQIREALDWTEEELLVKVETSANGFKVERLPISHPQHPKKKLTEHEWRKIFQDMKKISQSGKKGVNLTEFIRHDRDTHF